MWWSYGPLPKDVAALDVDNDGDLDLIAIPNDNSKVVALINPGNGQFDDAERVELTEWNGNTYDKLYAHADVGGTRDGIRTLYAWKDGDPTIMQAIEWSAASTDVANRLALNTGFGSVQDVVRADIQNKGDESGELIYLTSSSVTIGLGISATISGFSGVLQKVAFADITGVCYCNTRTPREQRQLRLNSFCSYQSPAPLLDRTLSCLQDGWKDLIAATDTGIYAIPYVYPGSATGNPYSGAKINIGPTWTSGDRVVSSLEVEDIDGNGEIAISMPTIAHPGT